MKTIIAGSRELTDLALLEKAINESGFNITEVVSGGASGIDHLGELWAVAHKIPVKTFQPQWKLYGRGAGPIRNNEMAVYADACIVVWDGLSKGTKSMVDLARNNGLSLHVHKIQENTCP